MCLAIPGRVVNWIDRDPLFARAEIEFDGICRECSMACVVDAAVGEYVIVHAGIAISKVNEVAAEKALQELRSLGESIASEWESDP
jgi:hydrogenase expression/formation protein HypC